jgi:hypothetical protein
VARQKQSVNPFYPLLVIAGIAFCVTACAYGVMAVRAIHPQPNVPSESGFQLMSFLNRNGPALLVAELMILAVSSVLAISTDRYWAKRKKERDDEGQSF